MGSSHLWVILFFFLLIASQQLSVRSAEDYQYGSCADYQYSSFDCRNLSTHNFFSDSLEEECGLGIIHCVDKSPVLTISKDDDPHRFEVKSIDYSDNTIVVHDRDFTKFIGQNKCDALYNFSLPRPSSSSVPISFQLIQQPPQNNITFGICNYTHDTPPQHDYNQGRDGVRFCGENRVLHFFNQQTPGKELLHLDGCKLVDFPANLSVQANDLFDRLSKGFRLQWQLKAACRECPRNNALCLKDNQGQLLRCENENQGSVADTNNSNKSTVKKKIIITGVVSGVGGLLLICLVVFFLLYNRHRRKGAGFALFKTRNLSSSLSPLSAAIPSYSNYGVPVFTYEELEEATSLFDSNQELGDGGFGTVYYGKLRDGREVAVKRLYENNCKRVEQFMNEIGILARLRHPNLVTLYGCTSRHSRELLLVYEFIPNGTVADHLHGDRADFSFLLWPTRLSIAIETAQALAFLHVSGIVHRDVKTNNILLCQNFQVKVADFGLSRLFPTDVTHISTGPQGTPGYVDPEYHQCYRLTEKSDVYSFGVVLIELISSLPAVDITRHRHEINLANLAINKIQNQAVDELIDRRLGYETNVEVKAMTTSVAALAFRCIQYERELRPSMFEVLEVLKGIQNEDYLNNRGDIPMEFAVAEGASKNTSTDTPVTQPPLRSAPAVSPNSLN